MADGPSALSPAVSRAMSRMPRRDTTSEMALRRLLHARGLRYRINAGDLPGRPDIVFTRVRLVVFVDGCFWHRCPRHATEPKHNHDWWQQKLEANVARDLRQTAELEAAGWTVLRIWEHDLGVAAADRVQCLVTQLRAGSAS
jgi:DNA mismatch endonuclease (patch repair protein)